MRGETSDGSDVVPELLVAHKCPHASGVPDDPSRTCRGLAAPLDEMGAPPRLPGSHPASEELFVTAWRGGGAARRRVVLVGGDGSLHAAANARFGRLPELAMIPPGRANNIARALGIPTDASAVADAAHAPRPPPRCPARGPPTESLYAVEAVSAGFQADARSGYDGENSGDLRRAYARWSKRTAASSPTDPRPVRPRRVASSTAASSFLEPALLRLRVQGRPRRRPERRPVRGDPRRGVQAAGADATSRGGLHDHVEHPGVHRISTRHAELSEPLPLVADAVSLGTTTATVSVERDRLRVAAPDPRGRGHEFHRRPSSAGGPAAAVRVLARRRWRRDRPRADDQLPPGPARQHRRRPGPDWSGDVGKRGLRLRRAARRRVVVRSSRGDGARPWPPVHDRRQCPGSPQPSSPSGSAMAPRTSRSALPRGSPTQA